MRPLKKKDLPNIFFVSSTFEIKPLKRIDQKTDKIMRKSKYIQELIHDIRTRPESWSRYGENGLKKNNIKIKEFGNGTKYMLWITSIADPVIDGKSTWSHLSWWDKYCLEETFIWWMRNATLDMLSVR
jgi:uncharacterized protein YdcH (DUF465 family)